MIDPTGHAVEWNPGEPPVSGDEPLEGDDMREWDPWLPPDSQRGLKDAGFPPIMWRVWNATFDWVKRLAYADAIVRPEVGSRGLTRGYGASLPQLWPLMIDDVVRESIVQVYNAAFEDAARMPE